MLVDAFMFYNELDILELRLELLDRYVDRFVLVESEVTHVGGPKELFFQKNSERFAKWLPKIEHVIMTAGESPKDADPWAREKYQRHCILRGLEGVPNESIVMVSDVDEIPDMTKIPFENLPHVVTVVHMWLFIYSLDYMCNTEPWFGTVITTCELVKKHDPNYFRTNRQKFYPFPYAGWHMSYFGDAKHVLNKIRTFAHALDATSRHQEQTVESVKMLVERGVFVDERTTLTKRPADVPLPGPIDLLRKLKLGKF